jgi:flavodoxin
MMRALVVYESMFGNTAQIARAVAEGLGESVDVQVTEVTDAPTEPDPDVALIVAGGPTHAFSMSRTSTRGDAINQGAHEGEREFGLREWMAALPAGQHTEKIATFDTKIESMHHIPGSAAKGAAKAARRHGYESAAKAESFYVHDVDGPLLDGELDRARAWGRQLAASITQAAT